MTEYTFKFTIHQTCTKQIFIDLLHAYLSLPRGVSLIPSLSSSTQPFPSTFHSIKPGQEIIVQQSYVTEKKHSNTQSIFTSLQQYLEDNNLSDDDCMEVTIHLRNQVLSGSRSPSDYVEAVDIERDAENVEEEAVEFEDEDEQLHQSSSDTPDSPLHESLLNAHAQQLSAASSPVVAPQPAYKEDKQSEEPPPQQLSEFEISLLDLDSTDKQMNDFDDIDLISTRTDVALNASAAAETTQNTIQVGVMAQNESNLSHPSEVSEEIVVRGEILDGYKILKYTKIDLPEHVIELNMSSSVPPLIDVVPEHLFEFTNLQTVNLNNNFIPFEKLRLLEGVHELSLACNQISVIQFDPLPNIHYDDNESVDVSAVKSQFSIDEIIGFPNLRYLDLSFNLLTQDAIFQLGHLPKLQTLLLESNELFELPPNLSHFRYLTKLNLRGNFLGCGVPKHKPVPLDGEFRGMQLPVKRHPWANRYGQNTQIEVMVFKSLSTIPNLTDLDLTGNLITYFPPYLPNTAFPRLYALHLKNNCINTPDDLLALGDLPCRWVDVRDNPFIEQAHAHIKDKQQAWNEIFPNLYNTLIEKCGMNLIMLDRVTDAVGRHRSQHIMHLLPTAQSIQQVTMPTLPSSKRASAHSQLNADALLTPSQQQEQYDHYSNTFLTGVSSEDLQQQLFSPAASSTAPLAKKQVLHQAQVALKSLLNNSGTHTKPVEYHPRYQSSTYSIRHSSNSKRTDYNANRTIVNTSGIRQPRIAKVYAKMQTALDQIESKLNHVRAPAAHNVAIDKFISSHYIDPNHAMAVDHAHRSRDANKERADVDTLLRTVTDVAKQFKPTQS